MFLQCPNSSDYSALGDVSTGLRGQETSKKQNHAFSAPTDGIGFLACKHCSSCSSKDGTEFVRFQTSQKATASAAVKTLEEVLLHNRYIERVCVCAYVYYKAK